VEGGVFPNDGGGLPNVAQRELIAEGETMTTNVRNWQLRCLGSATAMLLLAAAVWAAEGRARLAKIGTYNPADQSVEMFAAIESGDIAVQVIPKNSTQCNVLIKNNTDKPLNVKLPEAFAAVPVLAQPGGGAGGGGAGHSSSNSGNNNNNANQSMGGGMGGMGGGGMGGGGMGMGMWNVPPEKVGQLKVATVCLEHGKNEPHAKIPYEIKPLESFTDKPGVRDLCEMLGKGKINQRAAQAAAWNLNNGLSWQQLALKRTQHANGTSQPYFTPSEIQAGMRIAATAVQLSGERQKQNATTSGSAGRSASDPASGK
jgi:hypothetical protein